MPDAQDGTSPDDTAPDDTAPDDTAAAPRVVDQPERSRFALLLGDVVAGWAEYERTADVTTVTHTVVDPAFGGRGLGSVLARGVLQQTRAQGRRVRPVCPFLRKHLLAHPEDHDLVPDGERERFGLPTA